MPSLAVRKRPAIPPSAHTHTRTPAAAFLRFNSLSSSLPPAFFSVFFSFFFFSAGSPSMVTPCLAGVRCVGRWVSVCGMRMGLEAFSR